MPDAVLDGSIVALRGWELFCLVLWLAGFVLVARYGRTRFLTGIYAGATLCALFWDWILGGEWFFRLTFDERFFMLYSLEGRPEPVWAPLSYGFFFGITSLVALRYRRQLDEKLGKSQFVIIPIALGLSDIIIEGITVGALDLYVFRIHESWLAFGVPYTNVLFIVVTEFFILYAARGMGELLERAGFRAIAGTATTPPTPAARTGGTGAVATLTNPQVTAAPTQLKQAWGPLVIGLLIPSGAVYMGTMVTTLVLNTFKPW